MGVCLRVMRTMIIVAALILSASFGYAAESCRTVSKEARTLTADQKQKVRELRRSFHAETAALTAAHRETLKQYQTAQRSGDTATAESLKPMLESYRAEMKQRRAVLDERIAAVKAEQR